MRTIRAAGPWVAAGLAWGADLAVAVTVPAGTPWHGVLDAAAAAATMWALFRSRQHQQPDRVYVAGFTDGMRAGIESQAAARPGADVIPIGRGA